MCVWVSLRYRWLLPPRRPPLHGDMLPDDCNEMIMERLGSDLGRFACVSTSTHRITDEASVWRETYQVRWSCQQPMRRPKG